MSPNYLRNIIQRGEGIQIEFKKAQFELPKNVFESVCAMLNRQGGHLFLGVSNEGKIEGVLGSGKFRLDSYTLFPKNPVIAAFFREIGRAEELGSGYRNSERYTRLYSNGSEPVFEEGDVFKTIIPLGDVVDPAKGDEIDGATKATKLKLSALLNAIVNNEGKRTPDYKAITNLGGERTIERYIELLRVAGFIEFIGSAAQTGGYYITDKLKKIINKKPSG
ncbi:MAG: putative DNA binding domain-containing protein [Cryomorphaceae bacterium]|nr:putative DNA binding domain-containing protein [Cryomorphaceae bacterium]